MRDLQNLSGGGLRSARLLAPLAFACLVTAYPFAVSDYLIDIGFFFGIYALLGLSLNIVLGEVGLFDLGHAGFYAIGAYVTAVLNTRYQVPVLVLMPVSCLAAALFAYLVCSPIIHLKGDYLCIVTIGMGEIVRLALINNPFDLTGGPNGVFGIDFPRVGNLLVVDSSIEYYFLVWITVGVSIAGLVSLQHSRIGRAWNCIREDAVAAQATGINVRAYKLLAFVLGAALAGAAGNIYASKLMCVSPESFTFWESCLMFCIVLIGGMGSIPGVIVGAAFISLFPEIFRPFAMYRMLVFGSIMIVMMMVRPGGFWPRKRGAVTLRPLMEDTADGAV
ncbi:MAG TPA: branched-chain amino acid ABC transporter permease [Deltaproteobacteria bacterium]|nr:branched-chain amino acid ABC transporter permease [Deltaproteobacteria bacterium]HOM28026.1 branched-chain amino acid ABC transporter permease [Deltaproteobacteria bacterium]HPP80134.1 branched-chain amino acid ABC transporter permease [Deltaproteobacteria bacterium]